MSDKYFLDTNILVYSFDSAAKPKQKEAQRLIQQALEDKSGVISTQVVQEFLNVATRKFKVPLSVEDCRHFMETALMPLCEVFPSFTLYEQALKLKSETGYSFYDSLILAAAIQAKCTVLFSEDLKDGHKIGPMKIKNPF